MFLVIVNENGAWKVDTQHEDMHAALKRHGELCPEIDGVVSNAENVEILDTRDAL